VVDGQLEPLLVQAAPQGVVRRGGRELRLAAPQRPGLAQQLRGEVVVAALR